MIAIPHDDVADAHRDPDPAGPLDLRAADLDRVAVADIVFDRSGKPRRRHVEIDRPGAKPPPQAAEATGKNHQQRREDNGDPPEPAPAGEPAPQRSQAIGQHIKAGVRPRQQPTRTAPRRFIVSPACQSAPSHCCGRASTDGLGSWVGLCLTIASRCRRRWMDWMGNKGYACRHLTPPLPSGTDLTSAAHLPRAPKANLKSPKPLKPIFANSPSIPAIRKSVRTPKVEADRRRSACHPAESHASGRVACRNPFEHNPKRPN